MNKIILLALLVVFALAQNSADVVVVQNDQVEASANTETGSYEVIDGVYHLNENNFKNALEEFDYVFVKFFAPWCGHCKHMAGAWVDLAKSLKESNSQVKIAEVDCTVQKSICQQKGIRGYPTLLWFQKSKDSSEKYSGARSVQGFTSWINQKLNIETENVGQL